MLGIALRFIHVSQIAGGGNASHTAFNHRGAGFLNAGDIACNKDTRQRGLAEIIAQRNLSAPLRVIFHRTACHFEQLRHRRQTDCQTNGIDIEMLFSARNKLE